jgi:hypothetical protein
MKNKRGDFTGLIYLIVSVFAFAIFLLILGYIAPQISNKMVEKIGITAGINNSLNTTSNIAEHTLSTLWIILFGGLILGLFVTSYFIPTHPIFVPVFGFLLIVAIMIAVPLSNAYESLTLNPTLAGTAAQQGLIGFIMTNLPLTTLILGLIVLVITFAKPGNDGGQTLG